MRDGDAFGLSGGARGVDDVGGGGGVDAAGEGRGGLLRDGGAVGVEIDDAGVMRGQALAQRALGDEERRGGVGRA